MIASPLGLLDDQIAGCYHGNVGGNCGLKVLTPPLSCAVSTHKASYVSHCGTGSVPQLPRLHSEPMNDATAWVTWRCRFNAVPSDDRPYARSEFCIRELVL